MGIGGITILRHHFADKYRYVYLGGECNDRKLIVIGQHSDHEIKRLLSILKPLSPH